jgi:hypothetical protein
MLMRMVRALWQKLEDEDGSQVRAPAAHAEAQP